MDGEVYDKFRDAYTLFAQIELDCASYTKANFEDLREQASLVSGHIIQWLDRVDENSVHVHGHVMYTCNSNTVHVVAMFVK